jgi:2-polyprenyl-6-methoxyphenol hydroxylase-like FAD-dependent oxidoreductase
MASQNQEPFLITGGGIGLAAACALARKGFPVRVLEQAPEFKLRDGPHLGQWNSTK